MALYLLNKWINEMRIENKEFGRKMLPNLSIFLPLMPWSVLLIVWDKFIEKLKLFSSF